MTDTNTLTTTNDAQLIEQVVLKGDLSQMSPNDRVAYYRATCESLKLNPLTRPFDYIQLNGKLTLYAKRDATDQIRKLHNVSINITSREQMADVYIVTARATTPDGRCDESTGVVSIANLKGNNLANALMKAETKAKRRVTLSIVGLGWLDETEIDTIPSAELVDTDTAEGSDPQAWLPDFDEFKAKVEEDFNCPWPMIAEILKDDCNFTGFKTSQASEMYNCLAQYFAKQRERK